MDKWNQLNAGCSAAEPPRELEVPAWLRSLNYSTERLDGLVSELEARLSPALSSQITGENVEKSPASKCQLSSEIQGQVGRLAGVELRIASIIQRLEF